MTGREGPSSLWDLYRSEVETHTRTLNEGLLALERDPTDADRLNTLLRAAHSIKGAARVVRHSLAVEIAHVLEDRLVAARSGAQPLDADDVQRLLEGADLLERVSPPEAADAEGRTANAQPAAAALIAALSARAEGGAAAPAGERALGADEQGDRVASAEGRGVPLSRVAEPTTAQAPEGGVTAEADQRGRGASTQAQGPAPARRPDRALRLSAQALDRLLALASEATVSTRWLDPFARELVGTKRGVAEAAALLQRSADAWAGPEDDERRAGIAELRARLEGLRADVAARIAELEGFALRQRALHDRLHREVVATRMRPFRDVAEAFPRFVRDTGRQLGKRVELEIDGGDTQVDRDVADVLDSPLIHLLRNAVDHGIEPPAARVAAGKPQHGTIRLSAFHRAGMLRVRVADDGRGVDPAVVRAQAVERGLVDPDTAGRLTDDELLSFLFLPGVSTAAEVTELSGRGVGLDAVREAVKRVGGRVAVENRPGAGVAFTFDLPLTLSVLQVLVVEVAGEPYAVPLTRIERIAVRRREDVRTVENREYLTMSTFRLGAMASDSPMEEQHVGIVTARQLLELGAAAAPSEEVSVVVVRDGPRLYGVAVDRLVGEQFVVVRPLDPRLGKVQDVSAAAITVEGTPLLVLDVDDLLRSIERVVTGGRLERLTDAAPGGPAAGGRRKRVLIVEDSITVREIERQVLEAHGYAVDVAVDGMDGWNAVRSGAYDLVVTDVDMPRMDGIDLVRRIRADRRHASLPVMIVSYQDRDEDRLRGLDAGASYYLPKGAFGDDRFVQAVGDLIGQGDA